MRFKFMFKIDEPTMNDRIYSRETIEFAISEMQYASEIYAYIQLSEFQPTLSEIVGPVKSVDIEEDGSITIDVDVLKTPSGIIIKEMSNAGAKFQINPHMFASYDEETKEVTNVIFKFFEIMQEVENAD